ncbi:heterokaryon incompatibility protein-domain-containing protein [Biscogniauxia sp. FL1348]|nr:heterokaryon incompatibility protein-domain-containing protein [Biscogniauxia sp. FL1348]
MSFRFNPRQTRSLYPKLPVDSRQIRLVTLPPGKPTQRVACELHEALVEEERFAYKALSYAWHDGGGGGDDGDEPADVSIVCNMTSIKVSSNLHAALLRLRKPDAPVKIWVDSLCINQKDPSERTHQVGMMREIYQNSSEVVVWLGGSTPRDDVGELLVPLYKELYGGGGDDIFEWSGDERDLRKVSLYYSRPARKLRHPGDDTQRRDIFGAFCILYALYTGVPASHIHTLRHLDEAAPIIQGFGALVEKTWWRRVWVVQEVVVAQKATIYYGQLSAPWEFFSGAAAQFESSRRTTNVDSMYPYLTDGETISQFSRMVTDIDSTRKEWMLVEPIVLLSLLRKFRSRQASDARDKVFALLGLVRFWGRGKPVSPDYSHDAASTFTSTAKILISSMSSLSVLAGTLRRPGADAGESPSWVIDWSCEPDENEHDRLQSTVLYDAGRGLSGTVLLHGHEIIEAPAHYIDQIAVVGEEMPAGAARRMRLVVASWEALLRHAAQPYVRGGGRRSDAFWRTLCGDAEYLGGRGAGERRGARSQFRRMTRAGSQVWDDWRRTTTYRTASLVGGVWQEGGEDEAWARRKNAFHHAVECASGGRRFFVTRRGYVGTGPRDARPGDAVFLLCGSRVPFLLRDHPRVRYCLGAPLETLFATEQTYITAGRSARVEPARTSCHGSHADCYSLVGDAYVHGIMDGEGSVDAITHFPRSKTTVYLV